MTARRGPRGLALAAVAILAGGCPSEDEGDASVEAGADAAVEARPVFVDDEIGVRFSWPAAWSRAPTDTAPNEDGVATIAKIVRANGARVPPRVELTTEPTTLDDPRLAARRVKNVLEARLEATGVDVRRVSLSERRVGADVFGRIDLRYDVPLPPKGSVGVHHRSVVAVRPGSDGSLAILTLTATYLARDAEAVSREVEAILESLSVTPAPAR